MAAPQSIVDVTGANTLAVNSSGQAAVAVAAGTAGTAAGSVVTVQGASFYDAPIAGNPVPMGAVFLDTPVPVSNTGDAVWVWASSKGAIVVAGTDGVTARNLLTDSTGRPIVQDKNGYSASATFTPAAAS